MKMKIYGKIERVYVTTTDGYINVITSEMTYRFEGIRCCPIRVLAWIKLHPEKCQNVAYISEFCYDD